MRSISRSLASSVRSAKDLRLVFPPRNRIAYEGWAGHSNMGDEAILDVCRRAFPDHRLVSVAGGSSFDQAARFSSSPVLCAALLGGGTLIGRPLHRRPFERWLASYPSLPAFALGVGVLDPDFESGIDGFDVWGGLRRWREVLQRFQMVTVRGPRSQEILAAAEIRSDIVGDPGLLVASTDEPRGVHERLLGLNVGVSSRRSQINWKAAHAEIGDFARVMVDRGWRVRLIPLWDDDVPHAREVARSIGHRVEVVERWHHLPRLLEAISQCEVFVGVKLHSVVFASALGVPSLMLEYEPKCLDFQRSIGRERFSLPLADARSSGLVDYVDDLSHDRDHHSDALRNAVARRQHDLGLAIEIMRASLDRRSGSANGPVSRDALDGA